MEKVIYPTTSDTEAEADNALSRRVESAGSALHSGIDKVADPARQAVDKLSSAAHQTVDKIAANASSTADKFAETTRRLTDSPNRMLENSKSWVQERPLEAVGAALAVGYILGRLTSR